MQPNPEERKRASATPAELKEVFAFLLLEQSPPPTPEETESALPTSIQRWQESPKTRGEFRQEAASLIDELAKCGINLRAADSRKVANTLMRMRTIPERTAYTEDELK